MRFRSLAVLALGLALAPLPAQETRSDTLFTVEKYLDFEQVADPQVSPDGSQIIYTRRFVDKLADRWESALWLVNADGSKNRFLLKGSNARWSPDGTRIVYTADGEPNGTQIFVRWMDAEGATSQVTRVGDPIGDVAWAPDGKSIGFSMFVPSKSELKIDMPAAPRGAKWTETPKYVDRLHYRYDRRGFLAPGYRHLFVVSADGGTPRQITKGQWSIGFTMEGPSASAGWDWTPDGRSMVFERRDTATQTFRTGDIYTVDVNTGAMRRLTPQSGSWSGPAVSPDGRKVAFRGYPAVRASYRANDIYIANLDGSGLTKISGTMDRDPSDLVWAPDNSGVYFAVGDQGASNLHFASVGGNVRKLTSGAHMLSMSSTSRSGAVAAGIRSAAKEPGDVVRVDLRSGAVTQLTRVNEDLLARIKLGELEEIWYTSSGGTRVQGWIVKPPGFDASRKYPLLMEIHGGPHGMYNVGFNPMFQNFAANGYVVIYTNPRGSTGYGSAIENAYPSVDYDDLIAGVDAVIAKGYVDTTRMYVGGCSGGGVLSSWVIGHTNRFAAAAVRCPVINWMSMAGQSDIPLFTYNFFAKPFWEDPTM